MTAHAQQPQTATHLRVVDAGPPPPPADLDAEASVLSAVILDREAMPKVIDFLRDEHFYSEAHRRMFEASIALFRAKQPLDAQTVASWLHARKRLAQVGGAGYIAHVLETSPVVANVRAHAVAVHDMWRRRQLMAACDRLSIRSGGEVGDVQALLDEATKTVAMIGAQSPVRPIESNEQALERILADAFSTEDTGPASTTRMSGFPTGLHGLDRILGGLRKSAKTTIAASTGVGKTALAMQLAVQVARQGVGVLFFSTELKREELLRRALANVSNVSSDRIRSRRLNDRHRNAMREANAVLKTLPWRIDETPRLTIEEVCAATKAAREEMLLVDRVPLGMVVLDYIQRIEPSRHMMNREKHEQLGHASRSFKQLCQELDIVGLELAQSKDAPPGRKPEKPKASNGIADSSQIAKESDDVIFLVSEGALAPNDPRQGIEAWIAKNRAGQKNVGVSLLFTGDLYRFNDPNTPSASSNPSRQYVDQTPEPPPKASSTTSRSWGRRELEGIHPRSSRGGVQGTRSACGAVRSRATRIRRRWCASRLRWWKSSALARGAS